MVSIDFKKTSHKFFLVGGGEGGGGDGDVDGGGCDGGGVGGGVGGGDGAGDGGDGCGAVTAWAAGGGLDSGGGEALAACAAAACRSGDPMRGPRPVASILCERMRSVSARVHAM